MQTTRIATIAAGLIGSMLILPVSLQPLSGFAQPVPRDRRDRDGEQHAAARHFDKTIAPLLARHCLECHSTPTTKGGLDLSHKPSALAGGESGRAIVPGKSADSLLWGYVESDHMPKERPPLPADEKKRLKQWIDDGAVWGTQAIDSLAYTTDRRAGYDWWSLQPVTKPSPPPVKDATWPAGDLDRFILAQLEAKDLKPAPEADRRTLIRRLHFDLIGLPPVPEAVERFVDDKSPTAYENLVDELLHSPHYGERWARHWLDVVRFGETQGFERNRIRDNAWRYRDWVIQSFNRDLPYDEFVRLQIAGDVLHPGDYDSLIATGYHVCGTWDQVADLEGSASMQKAARQDHIEDLVATLGQAFLGLTINCGRCHDHKFDPVSQQDYYQMAALLGGVAQQKDERQVSVSRDEQRETELRKLFADAQSQLAQIEAAIRKKYERNENAPPVAGLELLYRFAQTPGDTIDELSTAGPPLPLKAGKPPRYATEQPPARFVEAVKKSGQLTIEAWLAPAAVKQQGPARIVTLSADSGRRNFTLGHDGDRFDVRLRTTKTDVNGIPSLASPEGTVETEKTHVVYTFDADGTSRLYVGGKPVAERRTGGDFSNWDGGFRLALGDELSGERTWDGAYHFLALYSLALNEEQIRRHFETESRDIRAAEPLDALLARATGDEQTHYRQLLAQRDELQQELARVSYSGLAHVIVPKQPPVFHVLARGDLNNPQQVVSPAGLSALTRVGLPGDFGLKPDAPEAERRKKLAEWLTDPRHPLTARVLVNRLWHYHFGQGLVDTPSDFGYSGGRPSHPALLDYLASRFVDSGWKIRQMQRLIVTSAAYRQSGYVRFRGRAAEIDADNRLLWRFNTRRLEGEALRDCVLAVSGRLNPQLGGPSYRDIKVDGGVMGTNAEFSDPIGEFSPRVNRRTIYRLWARSGNNPLLESLDCPDPSVMMPRRTKTITPVQALSLLNNTFIEKCAESFAARVTMEAGAKTPAQIDRAYQLAFARSPSKQEATLAADFIAQHGLQQFCLVLFNANEFLYVN